MKSLFPEIEKEILEDRKAARREQVQRARERLKGRDLIWLINRLIENGPASEHWLMFQAMEEEFHSKDASKRGMEVLIDLHSLWLTGKLWRLSLGKHPQSGEESYRYGIKRVHQKTTPPKDL